MLRFTLLDTADKVKNYYILRKSLEAYYSDNQEFNGYWFGRGAEVLGLKDHITDDEFSLLAENRHPKTGEQMTPRMQQNRRSGFDITFDCPKSVSLTYAFTQDDGIVRAVRQAAADTMLDMEQDAAARVRAGLDKNTDRNRITGNWVGAEFIHLTARPEDGWPDPHFHIHMVVFNLTHDQEEARWKALQMVEIEKEAPHYQGAFHRRLKENLESIGLTIVGTKNGFEIEGVDRSTNWKFSRRTEKIEKLAQELNITDPERKAQLGAMTRQHKDKSLLMSDLVPHWQELLTEGEKQVFEKLKTDLMRKRAETLSREMTAEETIAPAARALGTLDRLPEIRQPEPSSDLLGKMKQLRDGSDEMRPSMNRRTRPGPLVQREVQATEHDRRAVAMAMEHLFERESVVTEKRLLGEAYENWNVEKATLAGIRQAVAEAPLLRRELDGRIMVTTANVLAEENRLVALCQRGKRNMAPINPRWKISDERLNLGQREAALLSLQSPDFVTGVAGVAGGGKTTVMHEICRGIEAAGGKAIVLAPLAVTAHETLVRDGFQDTDTIAHFLKSEKMQNAARGAVLLVDEARMIPNRLGERFLQVAESLDARVILVGDSGQHHGVERGQMFDLLRDMGKMEVAEVTEILRQSGPYREFVKMYISGKPQEAVDFLRTFGALKQQPLEQLVQTFADDYIRLVNEGKKVLATSPTHAEGDLLTDAIRERMKKSKMLGSPENRQTLRQLSWTDEMKVMSAQYKAGMVVQFNKRVKDFDLGERVEVLDVRDEVVRLRVTSPGKPTAIVPLPLAEVEKFEVLERQDLNTVQWNSLRNMQWTEAQKSDAGHYRIGQVIQFNEHAKGFPLGEQLEVIGVNEDTVRVRSLTRNQQPVRMLPLDESDVFSVYERREIEITEGEKIRINGNGKTVDGHRLVNGSHHRVDHIAPDGEMVLDNGWHIAPSFAHVEHGYVMTSHAAQGMTVDWVLSCQTQSLSSPATDYVQHHVATTRGREGLIDYTDDVEWLKERVSEKPDRIMANEMLYKQSAEDQIRCEQEHAEFSPRLETDAPLLEPEPLAVQFGTMEKEVLKVPPEQVPELERVVTVSVDQQRCKLEKEEFSPRPEVDISVMEHEKQPKLPVKVVLGKVEKITPDQQPVLQKIRHEEHAPRMVMGM